MLPNFAVIGAMKAGTTSLWTYLKAHPQVFMADFKEPSFFSAQRNWHRGRDWYESLFSDAGDFKAIGEASTAYSKYPVHDGVPQRMAQLIPEALLVYMVRDPIERIRSHCEFALRYGYEKRPPEVAALEDPKYVLYSRYAFQIEQYLEWFPSYQLLVVTSESLRHERRKTLRRIFGFLGVESSWESPSIDTEHYVSRRLSPRAFARRLRRFPGYGRIARALPRALRSGYSRIATKEEVRPAERGGGQQGDGHRPFRLTTDVRKELERRLAGDVARLRGFLGDRFDGWGIA